MESDGPSWLAGIITNRAGRIGSQRDIQSRSEDSPPLALFFYSLFFFYSSCQHISKYVGPSILRIVRGSGKTNGSVFCGEHFGDLSN